jgi:succinate dehydrogenase / fumarate reductase cytochrome b subunit
MSLFTSTVGRKIIMAITGQLMVLFVVVHLLGNSSIFVGPDGINAYAKHLHDLGPLVWIFRLVMLTMISLHGWFGIQLTLENKAAATTTYAVDRKLKASFASENMIWTGLIILAFVVYHVLHFTARVTPDIVKGVDTLGRYDVYTMVVTSFQHGAIALIYVAAMIALLLHLFHGIQSFFQTMGWNSDRTQCGITTGGKTVAAILGIGYIAIPVSILIGILNK